MKCSISFYLESYFCPSDDGNVNPKARAPLPSKACPPLLRLLHASFYFFAFSLSTNVPLVHEQKLMKQTLFVDSNAALMKE